MCHLNAEAYPDSLALATDTTVTIGKNIMYKYFFSIYNVIEMMIRGRFV